MKKVIKSLIVLIVLGLVACVSNNTKGYAERNLLEMGPMIPTVFSYTYKDSKARAHKIILFRDNNGLSAVDLDVNTYK